jgi:hypothetical protein
LQTFIFLQTSFLSGFANLLTVYKSVHIGLHGRKRIKRKKVSYLKKKAYCAESWGVRRARAIDPDAVTRYTPGKEQQDA